MIKSLHELATEFPDKSYNEKEAWRPGGEYNSKNDE